MQSGIREQTCYRWRTTYGRTAPEMAKQLRALEKQNARLKKRAAERPAKGEGDGHQRGREKLGGTLGAFLRITADSHGS
ncbi:MAG: hypothetical protein JW810_14755 [Sedimentisphaerales bacterium]|nr:hypothetical protein [Sedimentisphaerales bacterium]